MAEEFDALPRDEGEDASQEQAPRRPGSELFEWFQMILGCVVAAVVIFNCFARLTRVDGDSMNDTLQHGELMLCGPWATSLSRGTSWC